MNVGSLFSGIGGLDLGLERAGMRVRWQCEIEPYCRAVLAYHWPDVPCYSDIRDIDGSAERVDLICGGFPCQPVSLAGKGLAQKDPRWLWPEFARVVGELRPRYVLVENVPGLVKRGLDIVVTGLAEMGYDAEWEIVSAAAIGAPHLRERIFVVARAERSQLRVESGRGSGESWSSPSLASVNGETRDVAHPDSERLPERRLAEGEEAGNGLLHVAGGRGLSADAGRRDDLGEHEGLADANGAARNGAWSAGEAVFRSEAVERFGRRSCSNGDYWTVEPDVGRVAHGVPNRLAQLRSLGNAVVPQVAEAVGRMIMEAAA